MRTLKMLYRIMLIVALVVGCLSFTFTLPSVVIGLLAVIRYIGSTSSNKNKTESLFSSEGESGHIFAPQPRNGFNKRVLVATLAVLLFISTLVGILTWINLDQPKSYGDSTSTAPIGSPKDVASRSVHPLSIPAENGPPLSVMQTVQPSVTKPTMQLEDSPEKSLDHQQVPELAAQSIQDPPSPEQVSHVEPEPEVQLSSGTTSLGAQLPVKEQEFSVAAMDKGEDDQVITKILPDYPPAALSERVQGIVICTASVTKEGFITRATPVSGPTLLMPAAIDAIRQWRYKPPFYRGEPVELFTAIEVRFVLLP